MYVFGGPSWILKGLWSEMQLTGLGMYPNVVHSLYALADLIYHDCYRLLAHSFPPPKIQYNLRTKMMKTITIFTSHCIDQQELPP